MAPQHFSQVGDRSVKCGHRVSQEVAVRIDTTAEATGAAASLEDSQSGREIEMLANARAPEPYFISEQRDFILYQGDAIELLPTITACEPADMIFADPPYFLSNGGITCQSGKMVSVNKGAWDQLESVKLMHEFNRSWLQVCKAAMRPNATIWVSGTRHVIYSVGFGMQELGFKLLNEITWEKPNPPPNLSCRYFTHSTETILWAARDSKSKHKFNYQRMRAENGDRQMKSVWRFVAPLKAEKKFGAHPTQKPLPLLERIVLAASDPGDLLIDPFVGSGTTGLAATRNGRRFIGIDTEPKFLKLATDRYLASQPELQEA
jgi:site-specific DNA-methyltransferase (adenine-specific)